MLRRYLSLWCGLVATVSVAVAADPTPEFLRELFAGPEIFAPEMSPRGDLVAVFVRRGDDFALGLLDVKTRKLSTIALDEARPKRLWWDSPTEILIESESLDGRREGHALISVPTLQSERIPQLAMAGGDILDPLPDEAGTVLVLRGNDLGRLDLRRGTFTGVATMLGGRQAVWFDARQRFRANLRWEAEGLRDLRWRSPDSRESDWQKLSFAPFENGIMPQGFDQDTRYLWVTDDTGTGNSKERVMAKLDTETGAREVVVRRAGLDPTYVETPLYMRPPVLVGYTQGKVADLVALSVPHAKGVALLEQKFGHVFPRIVEGSRDPLHWLVSFGNSRLPSVLGLFDSETGEMTPLIRAYGDAVTEDQLAPADWFTFQGRAGALTGRVWRPAGIKRPPLVVLPPHELPGRPVSDAFDPQIQALVAYGFAVVRVNVRGTSGFGHAFRAFADGDVSETVTEDLEDAIAFLDRQGVVDGNRTALIGHGVAGVLALAVAERSARYKAIIAVNMPSRVTRNFMLSYSDLGGVRSLSERLGGWAQTGVLVERLSPVNAVRRVSIPGLYLYSEESIRGRMVEDGREVRDALRESKAVARCELAFSYSDRPKPPLLMAKETAHVATTIAAFLREVMPAGAGK